jgi:hypothetical protein
MRLSRPVASFIASGRVTDLILIFMLIELAVLTVVYLRTGRGVPPPELAASLAAGLGLVCALRAALTGSSWGHIAVWLVLALTSHVLYVALRWSSHRISQPRRRYFR